MKHCCFNSVCCIYSQLIGNILINMLILVILMLSCYNFLILNILQKAYLILAIISWMALLFYSIFKFFLIIMGKFSEQYSPNQMWLYIHLPGFIIIGIALIYDVIIVSIKSGIGGILFYYTILLFVCGIFVILSIFDYCGIKKQLEISRKKSNRYLLNEEKENKESIKSIPNKSNSQEINPNNNQDLNNIFNKKIN